VNASGTDDLVHKPTRQPQGIHTHTPDTNPEQGITWIASRRVTKLW